MLDAVLSLCDKPDPSTEERVLRLMARLGASPSAVLSLDRHRLTMALVTGVVAWEQDWRACVVSLDPGLRYEVTGLLDQLGSFEGNLAAWVSSSARADGNGAARSKLRRKWRAWVRTLPAYRGPPPSLEELSQALNVGRLEKPIGVRGEHGEDRSEA